MHGNRTMAPEWHNIDAVMLAWPHAQTDWAPWLEDARATYLNVIAAVNRNDAGVILLCAPSDVDDLNSRLPENARVLIVPASFNDTWMRDYGFITCKDSEGSFVCFCNLGHTGNGSICLGKIQLIKSLISKTLMP